MLEKEVEKYLTDEVRKREGMCIKFNSNSMRGVPDRIVILPCGYVAFFEVKRPNGGRVSKYQQLVIGELRTLGAKVYVVSSKSDVDFILRRYDIWANHMQEDYMEESDEI